MNENKLREKIFGIIMESATAQSSPEFIPIDTAINSSDYKLFAGIVNQGIDSHLQGFTKSKFEKSARPGRFLFNFNKTEIPILLRRLRDEGTDEADSWANDIENSVAVNIEEDEDWNKETRDPSMFDVAGQFNTEKDLEYTPGLNDIKDMKDEFGEYINEPMSDDEIRGISNNLKQAKMRLPHDELELKKIQKSLDDENSQYPGGYKGKKMKKIGSSIN